MTTDAFCRRSILLTLVASLLIGAPQVALAGKLPGVFKNCTAGKLKVVVDGKLRLVMRPRETYIRSLRAGRRRVKILRKRDGKTVLGGIVNVRVPGWYVQMGCGRKRPAEAARLVRAARLGPFDGRYRNCSRRTLILRIDGKKIGVLPPGKEIAARGVGVHKVTLTPKGSSRPVFSRKFRFRPGWEVWWGCGKGKGGGSRRQRRPKCPKGFYLAAKSFCCPRGSVFKGKGKCIKRRRRRRGRRRYRRRRRFRCPLGHYRVGKARVCCPHGMRYVLGLCVRQTK